MPPLMGRVTPVHNHLVKLVKVLTLNPWTDVVIAMWMGMMIVAI